MLRIDSLKLELQSMLDHKEYLEQQIRDIEIDMEDIKQEILDEIARVGHV